MTVWLRILAVGVFLVVVSCDGNEIGDDDSNSGDDDATLDDDNDDSGGDDDNNDDTLPPDDDDDDDNDNDNNDDTLPDDDDDTISDQWDHELVDGEANMTVEMAIDSLERVHVTYLYRTDNTEMKYGRKENGNWLKETIAADSVNSVFPVGLDVDSKGGAHLAYHLQGAGELWYATNETGEFESLMLENGIVATSPEIVLDNRDNVYVIYSKSGGKYEPTWLWARIDGEWENSMLIEGGLFYCAAVDGAGHFYGESLRYAPEMTLTYVENTTGGWVAHDIATVVPGERFSGAEMVLSPSGALFFAFGVDEIQAKRYGSYYTDSYHAGWQEERIPRLGPGPRLAVDGDEKAHVTTDGWYATNRSGEWTAERVTRHGLYDAIDVDSENRAYIAYTDYDTHELYLATRKE